MEQKSIKAFEPWFFIFFGLFHVHRIWGIINRNAYANFWLGVMYNKGILYYVLMGILMLLCILGMKTFFQNIHRNYWWRWIYLFGGIYLLFDLFAIATGMKFWQELLQKMYDVSAPYWNALWSAFIIMGSGILLLGISLAIKRNQQTMS